MNELIYACPMCGSVAQRRLYDNVPDFVFQATDERWDIDRCGQCGSLFLPSRPDATTIGRYYEHYYTHEGEGQTAPISGIAVQSGIAKKLANSWRNFRYGSERPSLGFWGVIAAQIFPPLRHWIDAECRHLPSAGRDRLRVLDVGHGDARFLKFVKEIGDIAAGLEIDPKAVEQARVAGLDVHQGDIDAASPIWGEGSFDYVTMSHVIEHVHDPRHVIAVASRLLKPGGRLWIECPNPQARGLDIYRCRWRDLDPPRHLCIPSLQALRMVASNNGLILEKRHKRPFVPFEVYPFSSMASGKSARRGYITALWSEILGIFDNGHREWQTITFVKSDVFPKADVGQPSARSHEPHYV